MADVSGKFFSAKKVRTGVSPSSPGVEQGETLPPVNPPGTSLNSVGLTMPSAFAVANSPLTSNGTIAVTGAGTVGQYVRGDGSLADFPESSGGGSSVSYYLNGSVSQGTIGGVAYLEMNKVPILGAGTDFTRNSNGYIASFITDAGDPNLLEIPGGNWNFESYFSASSGGGSPTFYVELYKVNSGGTATLIASNSANPELISFGTTIAPYFSSLAVPTTVLALTDRLAVRYYVTPGGRTLTLHTEGPHLCQIITTFTTGLTALNGLTSQVQFFAVGTSGTDFNIASATATHTFNLPTASASNRGALSSADWTTFNNKENAITAGTTAQYYRGDKTFQTLNTSVVPELTNLYYTEARVNANANVAANTAARHNAVTLGTANGLSLSTQQLSLGLASAGVTGALSGTDWSTFNSKQQALNGTGFVKISGTTISYDNSTYLTTSAAASTYLALAGGTMTGNINWTANDVGLTWSRNTDGAAIKFISVGDGTGESYLQIGTSDNGNEAIVFTQTSLIRVQIDTDGLLKNGSSQRYVFENGGTWGIAVTNGVVTTGSYANPSWITSLDWSKIISRPTTLAGYGITDAVPSNRTITINGTTLDLSANRTYNVGTVTNVTASSPLFSSGGATPNITIQQASGSQNGFLSSSDWTTFNNKQNALTNPVTGTGTSGQVAYFNGTSSITGEANLFWDATNDRLGIGLANPSQPLEVSKSQNNDSVIQITNSNAGGSATAQFFASNGTNQTQFYHTGTSYGGLGAIVASQGGIYNTTSAGIALIAAGASGIIRFATGGTTARLTIDSVGAASFVSDVTANRYRGINSLILNTYTTVNPSSNVFLYSQPNDRDAWIFLDSADTGSNWGIYHRQIDTAVSGLPGNSIGFIGGGASGLQAWISLANGNGFYAGSLQLGTIGGGSSTATPNSINLTSTFSNTAGSNLKLILFNDNGGNIYGLGVSNSQMDFNVPSGASYRFYTGTATFVNKVGVGGASATYSITAYNASNGTTAAFGGTARGIRIDNDGTFSSGRSTIFGVDSSFYASYQPLSIEASSLALQAVTGGNVLIGTTTDASFKLDVNGTGRFSGALTGTSATFGSTGTGNNVIAISNNDQSNVRLRITNTGAGGRTYSIVGGLNAANNSSFSIFDETAGSTRFDIASTGAATFSSSVTAGGTIVAGTSAVEGTIHFGTGVYKGIMNYSAGTGTWTLNNQSSGSSPTLYYQFQADGSPIMSMLKNGSVGIGTASPESKLMINGDWADMTGTITYATNTRGIILNQDGGGGQGMGIWFRQAGLTAGIGSTRVSGGDWATDLRFYTHPSSTTNQNILFERMRINSEGNVLIGTTDDNGSRLQVTGPNSGSLPLVNLVASGTGTFQRGVRLLNSGMNAGDHIMMSVGQADGARNMGQFYFQYNGSGSTSNRLSLGLHSVDDVFNILGTGNVLIGTTSDNSNKLRVNGNVWVDGNVLMDNSVSRFVGFGTGTENPYVSFAQNGNMLFNVETNDTYTFQRGGGSFVSFTGNGIETFWGGIRTTAPTGTANEIWRLGRALLATSSVPEDRWIRVQLGTRIYDILAIDRGLA